MKRVVTNYLALLLWLWSLPVDPASAEYQIGCAKADLTGPPVGVQLWGFVREDQLSQGIHFRQWARAFVIAEPGSERRLAFVSIDIGSVTHAIHLSVVEKLQQQFGDQYTLANTILSATHTHAAPGGHWQYGAKSPFGGPFYQQYFDVIVDGIVAAIVAAQGNLRPGEILVDTGIVADAGANRSLAAYLNNPEAERAQYDSPTDREMTLLKFVVDGEAIGAVNWFPVHPTAMTYHNKLISGDHKGHGAYLMESQLGQRDGAFVAAFAQSNCGDVTPNLNLDNTGPGGDEFETTRIIAERQVQVAMNLFRSAEQPLRGPLDYRMCFVDFRYRPVDEQFTGAPHCRTCPSAYGYSFAAGSTEDGGGHPMFREGMLQRNQMVDALVKKTFKVDPPSDECRECHGRKVILIATGETKPEPAFTQILPMTLARIGGLAIVAVPAEFTTMAGRRLRATVAELLGDSIEHVVLAGYCNDYGGYVTTKEEYDLQHYEGGHTLYGPWTLAAYQQEFHRMATAMRSGAQIDQGPLPQDARGTVESVALGTAGSAGSADWGSVASQPAESYRPGQIAAADFVSANPRDAYPQQATFVRVERRSGDQWQVIATDDDWQTRCHWIQADDDSGVWRLAVSWHIPATAKAGSYRIGHFGSGKDENGVLRSFQGYSRTFVVE